MNRVAIPLALAALLAAGPACALAPDTYAAKGIQVTEFQGTIEIDVDPAATAMTLSGSGDAAKLREVTVTLVGDSLRINRPIAERMNKVDFEKDDEPVLRLTVPAGTGVELREYLGVFRADDGLSALAMSSRLAASMTVGRIGSVAIDAKGALQLSLADVTDGLSLDLKGASQVDVDSVSGALAVDIQGMGNVDIGRVDGPVSIQVSGAGVVDIADGRADPLSISVSGMANVDFDGVAVNPAVTRRGLSKVTIGGRDF